MTSGRFSLSPATGAMLADLGIPPGPALRAAGLPEDLFHHGPVLLTPEQFYRCWTELEAIGGPDVGPRLAARMTTETFQPPVFAALCSPDLRRAAQRIAVHKRLLGPQRLLIDGEGHPDRSGAGQGGGELHLTMQWPAVPETPSGLVAYELAFWVALARLGTRATLTPVRVGMPEPPVHPSWREYLGVDIVEAPSRHVLFCAADARRPFLTANAEMWQVLEPDLRRRLADLEQAESTTERVRAALVELLPAGEATATGVARRLALSSRTLQRRLAGERTTFQTVLDSTRHALARSYLNRPDVSIAEIAFLLGYDDPGSFHRAFRGWSGTTPHQARVTAGT